MIDGEDALTWRPMPVAGQSHQRRAPIAHYSGSFEAIMAYTAMGLSAQEYMQLPGTPYWVTRKSGGLSKSHVIAYYRYAAVLEQLRRGVM